MALGEFESQKALSQYVPDNAVIPLAYGTMELDSSKSFFLTTFRELNDNKCPDENEVAAVLSALHRSSSSPTGKFGFHVQTFNGWAPMVNGWYDTWEEYFSRQLRSDFEWTENIRGPDAEFNEVAGEFFSKVIPRLLRPLQTEGRSIRPVLLHGDVYSGNMKLDIDTSKVILFDSCCCYGHNESEAFLTSSRYLKALMANYDSGLIYDATRPLPFFRGWLYGKIPGSNGRSLRAHRRL
jgi:protein-ribulosamine 3-kinase